MDELPLSERERDKRVGTIFLGGPPFEKGLWGRKRSQVVGWKSFDDMISPQCFCLSC